MAHKKNATAKGSGKAIAIIALLFAFLAIAVIAVVGWFGWQKRVQIEQLLHTQEQAQNNSAKLQRHIANMQSTLQQQEELKQLIYKQHQSMTLQKDLDEELGKQIHHLKIELTSLYLDSLQLGQQLDETEEIALAARRTAEMALNKPQPSKPHPHYYWVVNLLSVKAENVAKKEQAKLKKLGLDTEIITVHVKGQRFYRIRIGAINSKSKALAIQKDLKKRHHMPYAWIQRKTITTHRVKKHAHHAQ